MNDESTKIQPDTESAHPALLAFSDQLATALNLPLQIWSMAEAQQQFQDAGSDQHSANADFTCDRFDLQTPTTLRTAEGECLLIIPLASVGYGDDVAVGLIDAAQTDHYLKIADLLLKNAQLNRDVQRLEHENTGLIRQVTDDLEELSFLRQLADHLKLSDASQGVVNLAQAIQGMLNFTIQAEGIYFVESTHAAERHPLPLRVMCVTGQQPISENQALDIVEAYQSRAVRHPLVLNYCRAALVRSVNITSIDSLILCPISNNQSTFGWLLAVNRKAKQATGQQSDQPGFHPCEFGTCEATLLSSAAAILATHMCNVDLFREKEQLLTKMVRCLVSAIEAKDPYTCGHSERVALYGKKLAQLAGYENEELDRLYLSGLLHDIGKIAISDATLNKTTHLNDDEFNEIKCHPDKGWAILHELDQLHGILPGVLYHHERIDGKGYPYQLRGNQIPLDGRILAVADSFDAMTSDRPYRKGMPLEQAVEILKDGAGTQWDATLVQLFLDNLAEFRHIKEQWHKTIRPIPPIPTDIDVPAAHQTSVDPNRG